MRLRTLSLSLCFILGLLSNSAMAGSGHDHGHSHTPVDQATARINATKVLAAFVERKKIDKSWASTPVSSVEQKVFGSNTEWVAVFVNDKVADSAKQKLYVFMTLSGEYIAANYTGQ